MTKTEWQRWQRACSACFQLYEVLPGGTLLEQSMAVAGTGAALIASLLEERLRSLLRGSGDDENTNTTTSGNTDVNTRGDSSGGDDYADADDGGVTVEQAVQEMQLALRAASRLDQRTGGESFHIWTLRWQPLQCTRRSSDSVLIAEAGASSSPAAADGGAAAAQPCWRISRPVLAQSQR